MSGKVLFIPLLFLITLAFKVYDKDPPALRPAIRLYKSADSLYNLSDASRRTDSLAMDGFQKAAVLLMGSDRSGVGDSILFQCLYKRGVLLEVYEKYEQATHCYLEALSYAPDETRRIKMYVFAGAGYYNQNNFDSANYFLLKAEESPRDKLGTEDEVRLFNTLGVLYYDNGNYLQAKNYFSQALGIIHQHDPADQFNSLSVQLNMATCNYRLGLYDRSLKIYRQALQHKLFLNQIYLNMGRAYAGLRLYTEALAYFRKVEVDKFPWVLNEMAKVALESGHGDSARSWLDRFLSGKNKWKVNAVDAGNNALCYGELDLSRSDPESALQHFQEAIILFSGKFKDREIRHNPASFTGSFAYYTLFDALNEKAKAWEMLYKRTSGREDLQSALDTYQSTISLLTYIERSYEMDDAKILLKQKSEEVYKNALKLSLELYGLYPESRYLEDAFQISERNKASVMASNLREGGFHFSSGAEDSLIRQERNLKFNIARLSIKAGQDPDSAELEKINAGQSVYESQLATVQKKMEKNSRYYQLKYRDDHPSVKTLQNSLRSDQALISLSNSPDAVQVFVITSGSFRYLKLDSGEALRNQVKEWVQILQSTENGKHGGLVKPGMVLNRLLVKPLEKAAGDKADWIVVPDGIFFMLPFESLPEDTSGGMLIEKHSLSYQFSSRFILRKEPVVLQPGVKDANLSFAPFATEAADLQREGMGYFDRLPESKAEISMLSGKQFVDRAATKQNFLKLLNRYPVIHLATHAVADLKDPDASYIAFYPASGMRAEDFLFLGELYGLRMDSCRLVVISACETGRGQLISNEGVMSFARAFLYAGCPSTINSLWKADDRSTSEILKRFHYYLIKGFSKSKALQQAKLEFIKKNPLNRNPAYWSHLILTGDANQLYKKKQPYGWAVLGICCCAVMLLVWKKRKKSRRFP